MPKVISDRTAYMLAVNLNLSGNRLLRAKIQTVSALPDVTEYISEFVYLSTDNKVYYSNGTNWIAHTQNTDYQCTLDGHYTPTENTASDINVTSGNFVSGIKRDAKGHVTGIAQTALPTSLKNPNSLTIQGNGTTLANGVYDGSAAKTVNITPSSIGAAASSHTHTFSQITDGTTEVNALIDAKISTANAMIYKGTLAGGSTEAYGALTPAADIGWTYKVTTAGKINGVSVEVGDMLICNTDGTAAATPSTYTTVAGKWDVIQGNLDGVVLGPTSATNNAIALFDGITGNKIKDSGLTIGTSVPSNAVFTDYQTTKAGHYTPTTASDDVTKGVTTDRTYIKTLTHDTKGHIISVTTGTETVTNTDTKVTSVDNHYSPAENTSSQINASGAAAQSINDSSAAVQVVTGIKRDAKGHVVGVVSKSLYATDTDTHYTTKAYVGTGTAANAVTTNGNTKLVITDDNTIRTTHTIKGTGATTVTSDASGNITINSTNTDTKVTAVENHYTPSQGTSTDVGTFRAIKDIFKDAAGHIISVRSITVPQIFSYIISGVGDLETIDLANYQIPVIAPLMIQVRMPLDDSTYVPVEIAWRLTINNGFISSIRPYSAVTLPANTVLTLTWLPL